jgi:LexA-binding, inner membrane-associated putative hydrolase
MYAGHFAAALAIKAKTPTAPTWALLLGTGFLDVLFGVFVMLGIERATMTPGVSPGFSLDFIDWSHSLMMALVWAALYSAPFWRRGRTVALAIGFAVFSHFLLDWPMHPADLALWPHSNAHVGVGLWRSLPSGWWWIELLFVAAACAYYVARAKEQKTFGGRALWACAVILLLHVSNSPQFSLAR